MGIYKNERVEMPDSDFYLKHMGDTTYVYQYTDYFRNANGKSRNKSRAIGILDSSQNMLIPNDNYYKLNNATPELSLDSVLCYGFTYLISHIVKETGLEDILSRVFPQKATAIIAIAAYMIHEGTVMSYCDDWLKNHYVHGLKSFITSQASSDIFENISHDERTYFFEEWVRHSNDDKNENIFYDVTSVSSYSSNIDWVEWGYNRDGEDLGQVNIGMFCGEKSRLPLYYNMYNGSLTDKANMDCVLQNAKDIGIEKVKLVLDGGFCDKPRLQELRSSGHIFTVGAPLCSNEAKAYVKMYGNGINKASNKLRKHPEYCMNIPANFMGIDGRIILCFNELRHSDVTSSLVKKVDELEEKLKSMRKYPTKNIKLYKKYFDLSKTGDGFQYKRNNSAIDAEAEMAGYFLLFSTDMESEVEDLLYFYRAKDVDEKMFCQLKVYVDGNRLRVHNNKTMSGKMFVIFIALIIRSYLQNQLSNYLEKEHITLKKAMLRLSDIKIIKSRGKFRFLKALTKKQKTLLDVFSIKDEMIESLDQLQVVG